MIRRALCAAAAVAVVAATVVPAGGGLAAADNVLSAYGADAAGTGVHVIGGSNAFPDFRTGAVDNSYPLAAAHVDASPAALATASVADTGPLGQTAAATANGVQQPQYATANYPVTPTDSKGEGTSVAEATVTETTADARGSVGTAGSGGPGAGESPDDPAHTSSDTGEGHATVDRATGAVTARSVGHVDHATFGGGVLVIGSVDVTAQVVAQLDAASPSYTVAVGGATVNGTPVQITDKGVVVRDAPLPGSDAMTKVVNEQLNQALTSSGFEVFVAPPVVDASGPRASVFVSGVHVRYTQPAAAPSVPTQSVEYVLGEARAFAFTVAAAPAAPAAPPAVTSGGSAPSSGGTVAPTVAGGSTTPVTGATATTVAVTAPDGDDDAAAAQPILSVLPRRPTWLVVLYFVWQALVIGTAATLVWWRRGAQVAVGA